MSSWPGGRALVVAACVTMIVLPLSLEGVESRAFGGYPAVGFAVALLVHLGRRWVWWALLVESVVIGLTIAHNFDVPLLLGMAASLPLTVPAFVVWHRLTFGGRRPFEIGTREGERRFIVATALGAFICGASGGLLSLAEFEPPRAALTGVMSFLSALAAQLAVLPMLDPGSAPATSTRGERVVQWLLLLGTTTAVFGSHTTLPLLFLVPAVLSWGANRGSPRASHLQLLMVSLLAYVLTYSGRGPLSELSEVVPVQYEPILLYLFLAACAYVAIPISGSVSRLEAVTSEATEAAATMERLLESAQQTMIVTGDAEGRITRFNRGAELMLGHRAEEVLGQPATMLHPPDEVARHARRLGLPPDVDAVLQAMVTSRERWDWEVPTKDGGRVRISMGLTALTDDDGTVSGYLAVGEDATARHAAHEALRAALEHEHASVSRLHEVDRVKQELVSNVSHELRTPITSISGYAELLADGAAGTLTPEQRQVVDRIDRNSQRLIRLVEDLLLLSRHESGALVLHRTPTDVGRVVREVVALLEEQLRRGSLTLDLCLPQRRVVADADPHELERVLVNLVGNAIKFTPDGGRVEVRLAVEADEAVVVVSDTGVGIAEDDVERLFGRFFRASSALENAIQGTGLGLAIAHSIVTAHGGTIGVESTPGEGTTMTVRLPLEHDDEVADEPLFVH